MIVLTVNIERSRGQECLVRGGRASITERSGNGDHHNNRRNAEAHLQTHRDHDDGNDGHSAPGTADTHRNDETQHEHDERADGLASAKEGNGVVNKTLDIADRLADHGIATTCHENERNICS